MTAARLGEELQVSESTVVRFAAGIGYEGYPSMQAALASWVKSKLNTVGQVGARYGRSTQSEVLSSVLQSDMENIRCTMEELDTAAFQTAVDIILEARNIYR